MIAMLVDLARDDLGLYTVAVMFVGFAFGMIFLGICLIWDRQQEATEGAINPSRRASSDRKSGRVSR